MKKILLAALAVISLAALQSCADEGNESHGTAVYNSNHTQYPTEMFADQTLDSIIVVSYDSWQASLKDAASQEWLSLSPVKCDVPPQYIWTQSIYLTTTPNTTGETRVATVTFETSYAELGNVMTTVYQYPWHNITAPQGTIVEGEDGKEHFLFLAPLAADATYALLGCTVYADATLTSDADWLMVQNEDTNLKPGAHGIKFVVDANTTSETRVAHVTLTSNGVSTVINYEQKAKQ